jgi:hypothetical protein
LKLEHTLRFLPLPPEIQQLKAKMVDHRVDDPDQSSAVQMLSSSADIKGLIF